MEKSSHIVRICGIEIGEIAVEIMSVRPIPKRDGRQIEPREAAVRLIQNVYANFLFHNVALISQILIVHFERAHAISLKPKHALERIRRHGFEIIRNVVIGRAVQQFRLRN